MNRTPWTSQSDYLRRFEWGPSGSEVLAQAESYLVVVDVLRFTTAVEAAVSREAIVYPYRWKDVSARYFADAIDAQLADSPHTDGVSLSPVALLNQPTLEAVVLPSPNGSTCSLLAAQAGATVVAACFRNAPAVAEYLASTSLPVSVIACGERWPDDTLRPSLEDLLGAGAVLSHLGGDLSPEAAAAVTAWEEARDKISDVLLRCSSGRELAERGCRDDIDYASAFGVSDVVPVLVDGAFRRAHEPPGR
jgi:2-phosphosulfolactate phosphatase